MLETLTHVFHSKLLSQIIIQRYSSTSELTYGAVVTNDSVRDATICTDAGVTANKNVLHHLAAVAEADSRSPIDVVARVRATAPFLVREVGLGREGVDPPPHQVR